MPANYVLLERIELNASASSVTFSNIPQSGYTDLKVVMSTRNTNNNGGRDYASIRFNGDSSTIYSRKWLFGYDNGVAASGSGSSENTLNTIVQDDAQATANTFSNTEVYIPNFTGSQAKSVSIDSVAENNSTTTYIVEMSASLWNSTAAINSMTIYPSNTVGSYSFVQYSTFSLYGLAAVGTTPVIAPKASGGNITTDGTYWYHTFLTSGTFTPATTLSCDALVVAGGGGGGADMSGGGGAGGLLAFTSQALTATSYTVTVGAGGAGSPGSTQLGSNGANSQFGALTAAVGGGRSGNFASTTGASGGSGGGAGRGTGTTGGAGTSGQGYAGGNGSGVNYDGETGGGGGAGAVGGNGSGSGSGDGGVGSSTYSSWGSATTTGQNVSGTYYYAGGGGGGWATSSTVTGSGGYGGGGNGASSSTASTAGTVNTGGGGGGGQGGGSLGQAGGSGIVIVRYTVA